MRYRPSKALGIIAVLVMCLSAEPSPAEINGDRVCSPDWQVCLAAPKNWQLTEQTSYPNVLLWMVRRNPRGKMLFTAEKHREALDTQEYANRTVKLLKESGFKVRTPQLHAATGAFWIDFENDRRYLRQAFLVVGQYAYSLTLAASDLRTRGQHLRSFDYALRSIRIVRSKGLPEK